MPAVLDADARRGRASGSTPPTVTSCPVGLGEDLVDRGGDPVHGARRDRLGWRCTTSPPSTVDTAQSTGRPRASAIEVMLAIASFLTFSPSVPGMSSPLLPTGDAAPMLVPGDM